MHDEASRLSLHATAILFGEHGFLLRGPSGSGKSSLALDIIATARSPERLTALVGDDRVRLVAKGRRLIARPHPAIEGLIELRNVGLLQRPFETACRIHGLIDLAGADERLPQHDKRTIELLGIRLYHRVLNNRNSTLLHLLHTLEDVVAQPGL